MARSDWWVTPTIKNSDLSTPSTLDQKIDVFQSQVLDWQLNIAKKLRKCIEHSGFAALSIVVSHFETMGKAKQGKHKDVRDKGGELFTAGVRDMLDGEQPSADAKRIAKKFFTEVRCGLYHIGMTKPGVLISSEYEKAIQYNEEEKTLDINPHRLVPEMIDHFKEFIATLRDPSNEDDRDKFAHYFS